MGRHSTRVGCCLILFAALVAPAGAQDSVASLRFDSGAVVRLDFADRPPIGARLVAPFTPDSGSYRFCPLVATRCRPWERTERPASSVIHVATRTGSRALRGWVIGTTACGTAAILVSPLADLSDSPGSPGPSDVAVRGILGGALLCGGIGALVGEGSPRWNDDAPGSPGRAAHGALTGAAIGFAGPFALCYLFGNGRCDSGDRRDILNLWSLPLAGLGAFAGALLGADP